VGEGQIKKPTPSSDVRDVGDPNLVRLIDSELSLQNVRSQQRGLASNVAWLLIAADRFDFALLHDPCDPVTAAALTTVTQVQKDPRATVSTTAGLMELFDQRQQPGILNGSIRMRLLQPSVVTATMDPQHATHHDNTILVMVGANECVL
jgi:hypothetical protein